MSRDVNQLRRLALDRDAVMCTATDHPPATEPEPGATPKEEDDNENKPTAKVELPIGLKHFCLPCRRSDKLAVLDWLVQRAFEQKAIDDDQTGSLLWLCCSRV